MREVITYRYGSFNDYKGQEHKIIICAVSQKVNVGELEVSPIEIYKDPTDVVGYAKNVSKILSFGVAICNPVDDYNPQQGEMIAYNRAKDYDTCPMIISNRAGFFNTVTVNAIINNYLEFIQNDPGSILKGYEAAKSKFFEEQDLKNDVSHMSEEEKTTVKILSEASPENIEYAKKVVKFL